ncbi:MAG: 3-isopropylmalate dehydratase large subunit [Candidatus Omnitrophica bacterium]|nr:3-isopropylmalate dehydratase large subunit [Candidatus Omnitrophota bacterium]
MKQTITQKILAAHCGRKEVTPGEFIDAKVDLCLGNDITAPLSIHELEKAGIKKVWNRQKIALVPDHFTPNKDQASARHCKILAEFAGKHKIKHYFEQGRVGVEHALLPEQGMVGPGDLVIGADSHTCTYGALGAFSTGMGSTDLAAVMATGECWFKVPESIKFLYKGKFSKWVGGKDLILFTIGKIGVDGAKYMAMEFAGPVIRNLPMDDRLTMSNMAIEAGGKNGIIEPDKITRDYIRQTTGKRYKAYSRHLSLKSDKDAEYVDIHEWNITRMEPQVACPHLPSNVKGVSSLKKISIDQSVIGSCTNGRISDLRIAARIIKGRKVNSRVRLIVIPATQAIYLQAMKEGLLKDFIDAGGVVETPTCGPCLGGHAGILAEGEVAIATTNRNFVGRMGHPKSFVYLSNPAVAVASAIKGRITHPDEVRP